jgi:hypothetical protein
MASDIYMYILLKPSVILHFARRENLWVSYDLNGFFSLNSVNKLILVMVKCGVFFEVRTEFLDII